MLSFFTKKPLISNLVQKMIVFLYVKENVYYAFSAREIVVPLPL